MTPASACGVPCGRIYPLILLQVEDQAAVYDLSEGSPVTIDATLTYKFDMVNEGYTAATPNEPIVIRFEYPRKPDWADIKVEPEAINVDVSNPVYVVPDTSSPTNPQASYVFTAPITITLALTGQAVLKDGYDYHKLLVFAKSSESGLYQAGYGIKEIRVVPEGAVHEADVAGSRDVFAVSPLPPLSPLAGDASFAGTTVSFTPPAGAPWWEPAEYAASISPAPANGRMVFALHDEAGALVASTQPLPAAADVRMNATLAKPGRHTASVTLLPDAGTLTPPMTFSVPFDTGDLSAEGFAYPKTYIVATSEPFPAPLGSQEDALTQFERDIPFWAFDTAQSVSATVTLKSTTPLDLGRAVANLQFSVHDPDGNLLQASSVDPTNPTRSVRVGSLAVDGWYVLRIRGVGAPASMVNAFDTRIEANYAAPHAARDRADGAYDPTGPLLGMAGVNLTIPTDALAVWAPSDATPTLDTGAAMRYQLTIVDANGTPVYASGTREGAATFSAPAPGAYQAFVYAEPVAGGAPFSPVVRAFAFTLGAGNVTVATTFAIDDGFEAPFHANPSLLGFHAIPVLAGAGSPTASGGEIVDAEGNAADATAPGTFYVRAVAAGSPPQGSETRVSYEQTYASAVELVGPTDPDANAPAGLPIPGLAVGLALLAVGLVAVGVAIVRRG